MSPKAAVPKERLETIPENLFREPIDYLQAEHFRQRTVCQILEDVALDPRGADVAQQAAVALNYLEGDLPLHIADEEEDLFPLLRARARAEDNMAGLLRLLREEHVREQDLSTTVIDNLRDLSQGGRLAHEADFLRAATALFEGQLRHLAWEDRLILPLTRKRLTAEDRETLGRAMAARRGVAYPE